MKSTAKIILLSVSLLSVSVTYAQQKHTVTGTVRVARERKPLDLVQIFASDSTGNTAARTVTLEDGIYNLSLSDGRHTILFEKTGYKSVKRNISVSGGDVDMGNILLREGEEINAAGISAESLLQRKNDRLVYDVSKDPDRFTLNMSAMMEKIPELRMAAKDGKLQYGQLGIKQILINDEESGIINARRQYPMEFIKAHYMKKIELVLPGSLEYGNTEPVLLITLSKALPYGAAASVSAEADTKHSYSPSADIISNSPLIGIGANYSYGYKGKNVLKNEYLREDSGGESWEITNTGWSSSQTHNMGLNVFRSFAGEKIRFQARLSSSTSGSHAVSESFLNGTQDERSDVTGHSPFTLNANVSLGGPLGKVSPKGLARNRWSVKYNLNNSSSSRSTQYSVSNSSSTSTDERTQHRLEASFMLRDIAIGSFKPQAMVYTGWYGRHYATSNQYGSDINGSYYGQNVVYARASTLGLISGSISYALTLMAEYCSNHGFFINNLSDTTPLDYSEFNILPIIGLSYKKFNLNYSRYLRRPTADQLNPYRDTRSPYLVRTGNPSLKGSATNIFSLSYSPVTNAKWLPMLNLSTSYSFSNNDIANFASAGPDGTAVMSYCNLGRSQSYGAKFLASFKLSKHFDISAMGGISRNSITLPDMSANRTTVPTLNLNFNWKPSLFELSCYTNLQPSLNSVQMRKLVLEPTANITLSRYFKKPRIGVSLDVNDVLHSGGMRESFIQMGQYTQRNLIERLGRSFNFRIYWRIGKFQNKLEATDIKAHDM